jgi:hypothetical protein
MPRMKEELPDGVSQETMDDWNEMTKGDICEGLWQLRDWLKYNTDSAYRGEHRVLSNHDYTFYRKLIENAEDRVWHMPPLDRDKGLRNL